MYLKATACPINHYDFRKEKLPQVQAFCHLMVLDHRKARLCRKCGYPSLPYFDTPTSTCSHIIDLPVLLQVKFWDFEVAEGNLALVHTRSLKMADDILCVRYSKHKQQSKLLVAGII